MQQASRRCCWLRVTRDGGKSLRKAVKLAKQLQKPGDAGRAGGADASLSCWNTLLTNGVGLVLNMSGQGHDSSVQLAAVSQKATGSAPISPSE